MFGTIDIEINAGHTNLPLSTVYAAVGSPLTIAVNGVPSGAGAAKITSVYLSVTYPDSTGEEVACTQVGDKWIGTLAGSTVVGVVSGGLKVLADGTNEQGSSVVGWVLGFGDLKILSTTATPTPASTIQPLADQYNLKQVKDKVNEIVSALAKCVLIPLALTFGATALAATNAVYTASYEDLMSDASVVTNVTFGDVTVAESDPIFDKWKNNSTINLGTNSVAYLSSVAIGQEAQAMNHYCVALGVHAMALKDESTAIGPYAYADIKNALVFSYAPSAIYFGSLTRDNGASKKSLQEYLDEAGSKPSATVTSASICYKADGSAIAVAVASTGTLAADLTGWTDGQAQTAFITLASGAAVNDTIKLVGYEEYPRDAEFAASVLRRGDKVYVIPLFGVAN